MKNYKYKIYYKGNKCAATYKGNTVYLPKKRHLWPEDNTEISLSVSGDTLYYEISNLSDRTQYLYDNDLLGLCVIVQENPSWFSRKTYWRSAQAQRNHLDKRCIKVMPIYSLRGIIDLNTLGSYSDAGAISRRLYYRYYTSYEWQDPYIEDGYDNLAIGIGRYYSRDNGMRPHKVSDFIEIETENKINW